MYSTSTNAKKRLIIFSTLWPSTTSASSKKIRRYRNSAPKWFNRLSCQRVPRMQTSAHTGSAAMRRWRAIAIPPAVEVIVASRSSLPAAELQPMTYLKFKGDLIVEDVTIFRTKDGHASRGC